MLTYLRALGIDIWSELNRVSQITVFYHLPPLGKCISKISNCATYTSRILLRQCRPSFQVSFILVWYRIFIKAHFLEIDCISPPNILESNGKVQNMDPWSMDPLRGPGPWTTFMDRVHGPPIFTTPKITEGNKNKIKSNIK